MRLGRRVRGGAGVLTGIYPLPRGTLQSVGPAAMLKPSVVSQQRPRKTRRVLWFDLSRS